MLRGCLIALFLWLALSTGYWYWLDHAFEPPGSIIGGLVAGLIVAGCLGALINARTALRDWSLAAASRHGLPLADGRIVAVSGTIHPIDKPLIAPFSGQECVICEYDLGRRSRGSSEEERNTGADYAGFLMTPCVIRTRQGDVRLLGFPILEEVGASLCIGFDAAKNGYEFLKRTEFENRTGLKLVTILSAFDDVWSDEDGLVQKNMRLGNISPESLFPVELLESLIQREEARLQGTEFAGAPPSAAERLSELEGEQDLPDDEFDDDEIDDDDFDDDDFDDDDFQPGSSSGSSAVIPKMTEKRIEIGESVCVIGTYNEMQRGLLPRARGRRPNRLIRGSAEKVEQQSRKSLFNRLLGGLIGLIVVNAAVYGVMQAYLHSPDTINRRQREAFQATEQGDAVKLKALLRRGVDPNTKDSNGRSLLKIARSRNHDEVAAILREAGAKDEPGNNEKR